MVAKNGVANVDNSVNPFLEEVEMKMKKYMLILLLIIAGVCNAVPLSDNSCTVGLWHMDSASSGIVADDDSSNTGRDNNLTLVGASLTTGSGGIYGEAVSYDGSDYSTASWKGGTSFVLDGWFQPDDFSSSTSKTAFCIYHVAQITFRSNNLYFYAYNTGSTATALSVLNLSADTWYHVIATVDESGAMTLNVFSEDGSLIGSSTGNTSGVGGFHVDTRTMYIGAAGVSSGVAASAYTGLIDDLRISTVPEPATLALFGIGCLLLRKKK